MNIGETEVAAGVGLGLGFLIGRLGGALAAACGGLCVAGGLLFGGCNAFASSFVTLACFDFGAGEGIISWSGRWNKGFLGVLAGGVWRRQVEVGPTVRLWAPVHCRVG